MPLNKVTGLIDPEPELGEQVFLRLIEHMAERIHNLDQQLDSIVALINEQLSIVNLNFEVVRVKNQEYEIAFSDLFHLCSASPEIPHFSTFEEISNSFKQPETLIENEDE